MMKQSMIYKLYCSVEPKGKLKPQNGNGFHSDFVAHLTKPDNILTSTEYSSTSFVTFRSCTFNVHFILTQMMFTYLKERSKNMDHPS